MLKMMKARLLHFAIGATLFVLPLLFLDSPVFARVLAISALALYIWLAELAPPFVPTLLLWTGVPLLLSSFDKKYELAAVLGWAADPVLALFFGGFTLGVAASVYGIDQRLAGFALRASHGSFHRFLLLVMLITAFMSMWLSNIAAAALVIAVVRPILAEIDPEHLLRRTTLVAIAIGADLGGIATPIGTGPNAIALASIDPKYHVSFVDWMVFALPITIGMLCLAFLLLYLRSNNTAGDWPVREEPATDATGPDADEIAFGRKCFLGIAALTIVLWLTEPFHHVPASLIAVAAAAVLFLSGLLKKRDLLKIDWSTLLLIAGGITLGRLLDHSGVIRELSSAIPFSEWNITASLFAICLITALLSALMSNTATAVLLIPLAMTVVPAPSTAILVAVSASFGLPFVISTPQNAMAFGEGGVKSGDLLRPGLILMIVGCLLVSLTGRSVLNFVGIP